MERGILFGELFLRVPRPACGEARDDDEKAGGAEERRRERIEAALCDVQAEDDSEEASWPFLGGGSRRGAFCFGFWGQGPQGAAGGLRAPRLQHSCMGVTISTAYVSAIQTDNGYCVFETCSYLFVSGELMKRWLSKWIGRPPYEASAAPSETSHAEVWPDRRKYHGYWRSAGPKGGGLDRGRSETLRVHRWAFGYVLF